MVRNIRPLEARGLITQTDGHGKTYALTGDGKSALDAAIPMWTEAQRKLRDYLGGVQRGLAVAGEGIGLSVTVRLRDEPARFERPDVSHHSASLQSDVLSPVRYIGAAQAGEVYH